MRRIRTISAVVLLASQAALAQNMTEVRRAFELAVEQMDSPSLAVRESATDRIMRAGAIQLDMVIERLGQNDLSAEQRARLLTVGESVFATRPRAAMGIQFGGEHDRGVVIGRTIPPFDAALKLQANDVIMIADGEELTETNLLREIIVSHDPDEFLEVVVLRGAEEIPMSIRLGRFSDLGQQRLDAATRKAAWRRRLERSIDQAPLEPEPVKPMLVEPDAGAVVVEGDPEGRGLAGRNTAAPNVVPTGRDRLADPRLDGQAYLGVPVTRIRADLDAAAQRRELVQQLVQLQSSQQAIERQIATHREQLDEVADPAAKQAVQGRLTTAIEMSREINLEVDRVRRQLAGLQP